jgi:hypothetical protein
MPTPVNDKESDDIPTLGISGADDFEPAPIPPGAASTTGVMAPIGGVGLPPALPPATPENWVCLRGPCRFYMHFQSAGEFGNPEGTFEEGEEPKMNHHYCTAIPGSYLDMGDDMIFKCGRWDPEDPDDIEVMARERRRSKYLKLHPDHDPVQQQAEIEAIVAMAEAAPKSLDDMDIADGHVMGDPFAIPPPAPEEA